MKSAVSAFGGSDRIGTARIVRRGDQRVVAAFAVDPPDRMDRRQVENVEIERRDRRQAADAVVEGRAPVRQRALAARKDLVPGAEARRRPVDAEFELATVNDLVGAVGDARHQMLHEGGKEQVGATAFIHRRAILEDAAQPSRVGAFGAHDGMLDQRAPLLQFERDRLAGRALLADLVAPRARSDLSRLRSCNDRGRRTVRAGFRPSGRCRRSASAFPARCRHRRRASAVRRPACHDRRERCRPTRRGHRRRSA